MVLFLGAARTEGALHCPRRSNVWPAVASPSTIFLRHWPQLTLAVSSASALIAHISLAKSRVTPLESILCALLQKQRRGVSAARPILFSIFLLSHLSPLECVFTHLFRATNLESALYVLHRGGYPPLASFVAERYHRIHPEGTARGDVAGEQGHGYEDGGDQGEGPRVRSADVIEQAPKRAG